MRSYYLLDSHFTIQSIDEKGAVNFCNLDFTSYEHKLSRGCSISMNKAVKSNFQPFHKKAIFKDLYLVNRARL